MCTLRVSKKKNYQIDVPCEFIVIHCDLTLWEDTHIFAYASAQCVHDNLREDQIIEESVTNRAIL